MSEVAGSWSAVAIGAVEQLLSTQSQALDQAAQWSAEAIGTGGLVHMFGSGHSRIPVEEMFPRYGSYPGFNPIVELSTTFHTQVVGANGQRQAMFIERVSGLAEAVLANFEFGPHDVLMVFSVGGSSALPIEMAVGARDRGVRTIAVTSAAAGGALANTADLVVDLPVPPGDAAIEIDGLEAAVGPISSFLYVAAVNEIKVRTAARLVEAGAPPIVLAGAAQVGAQRSAELFDLAYADHARRIARVLNGANAS